MLIFIVCMGNPIAQNVLSSTFFAAFQCCNILSVSPFLFCYLNSLKISAV